MKLQKLFAAAVLTLSCITTAFAAGESPFYVGAALGSSSVGPSDSTSVGAFIGYKLQGVTLGGAGSLAVEAQYTSLGSISYSDNFDSFGVDAVASFPIHSLPNFSVFGKLGVNNISGNFRCGPYCSYSNSSGLVLDFGFGGQYKFTRDFSVRAGYQYFDSNFSTIYAAAVFQF